MINNDDWDLTYTFEHRFNLLAGDTKHLLTSVGGDYVEVCNQDKKAKLSDNTLNRQLLGALQKVGYISSYQPDKNDKDKLKVYHKMKRN